jgi:FkbM family methyltransferase
MSSVLIFVPAYKNVLTSTTFLTTHALSRTLMAKGINSGVSSISSPDVEWVRGYALSLFYDVLKEYTHLLFVDDDMGFQPEVVVDMVAFGEPVVGALYRKKITTVEWAVSGVEKPESRGPFLEVEGLGMGCFLIRRDAVTAMIEKFPDLIDTRKSSINDLMKKTGMNRLLDFFRCIQGETGKVSEDFSFCRRWRETGGKVWAVTHHKITHVGPHPFDGHYAEWVRGEIERRQAQGDKAAAEPAVEVTAPDGKPANPSVLRTVEAKHGKFQYNPNDTFIGRSLEAYGEWCEFELDAIRHFVRPDSVILDVGANIGTHTVAFSRMAPQGKVFAFEPQKRLAAMLETNVFLNKLPNVFLSDAAVGNICGQTTIADLPPDHAEFNFGGLPLGAATPTGSAATVVTIDSLELDRVDLVKIDVEGMEAAVIRGAVETIKRCEPTLYLENNGDESSKVAEVLEAIGYRAFWSIGDYFNPHNHLGNAKNIWASDLVPSTNLIALPKWRVMPLDLVAFLGAPDNWRKALERAKRQQAAE